jgi:hypothetical protein
MQAEIGEAGKLEVPGKIGRKTFRWLVSRGFRMAWGGEEAAKYLGILSDVWLKYVLWSVCSVRAAEAFISHACRTWFRMGGHT